MAKKAYELKTVTPAEGISNGYDIDEYPHIYCPWCGIEQTEHPDNILVDSDGGDTIDCDTCEKDFFLSRYAIVTYTTERQ